jgi:hypothetical protein
MHGKLQSNMFFEYFCRRKFPKKSMIFCKNKFFCIFFFLEKSIKFGLKMSSTNSDTYGDIFNFSVELSWNYPETMNLRTEYKMQKKKIFQYSNITFLGGFTSALNYKYYNFAKSCNTQYLVEVRLHNIR